MLFDEPKIEEPVDADDVNDYSDAQTDAIDEVLNWHRQRNSMTFNLYGYAGTGKTTIAKEIARRVKGAVIFGAFTGKAASVLRRKGCQSAATIHSLIYHPDGQRSNENLLALREEQNQTTDMKRMAELDREIAAELKELKRMGFKLNESSVVAGASLVIIDECSMVGTNVGRDLMTFRTPVLGLGDPFQLPPVKDTNFFDMSKPDHMLTEVHRHALDSPIYRWAMKIREGQKIPNRSTDGDCYIKPMHEFSDEELDSADAIIAGKNITRHSLNDRMRRIKGYGERPTGYDAVEQKAPFRVGERLVCLANDHQLGIQNGVVYEVLEVGHAMPESTFAVIQPLETEREIELVIANKVFYGFDPKEIRRGDGHPFDYGYCLTCHKSQGSQWENVLVVDESHVFKQDAKKWLYTAVTRASDTIRIATIK